MNKVNKLTDNLKPYNPFMRGGYDKYWGYEWGEAGGTCTNGTEGWGMGQVNHIGTKYGDGSGKGAGPGAHNGDGVSCGFADGYDILEGMGTGWACAKGNS